MCCILVRQRFPTFCQVTIQWPQQGWTISSPGVRKARKTRERPSEHRKAKRNLGTATILYRKSYLRTYQTQIQQIITLNTSPRIPDTVLNTFQKASKKSKSQPTKPQNFYLKISDPPDPGSYVHTKYCKKKQGTTKKTT